MDLQINDQRVGDIHIDSILDLNPEKLTVIIRDKTKKLGTRLVQLNQKTFDLVLFKAIKNIKKHKDPYDRVYPFEMLNEHGVYSYDKEMSVIKFRATNDEKEKFHL